MGGESVGEHAADILKARSSTRCNDGLRMEAVSSNPRLRRTPAAPARHSA